MGEGGWGEGQEKCGHCQVAREGQLEDKSFRSSWKGYSGLGRGIVTGLEGAECGPSREHRWGERPGAGSGGFSG